MSLISAALSYMDSTSFVVSLCCIGILVCWYAMDIESGEKKPKYKRMCDVNDSMSCTLVLTSKYGHMAKLMFGLDRNSLFNRSNAEYGFVFYLGLLIFQFYPFTMLPFYNYIFLIGTVGSVCASIGLAWILYSILHNFCMICVCMYAVNTLLMISAIMRVM
ncbi:vitamin K epoxide reductase [Fadolivirus algeromassiliense]|jgi:vitamin-K-epoxide reductase (warfarin-sensitive)|uniref:vitamin-K-epoxide reductase (warfarin-sensitive) n=1 Tax=Fadolivirus FV1/VV64 TaxID=3070911 RepID=A0A7D3QUV5_9VIRU|nr:vitamin K epoxide reductase [Fadolivirus algeromassiliense]QKF94487.1 vitamin K epoxide reductase [Fadolivirus FV1/VV64]